MGGGGGCIVSLAPNALLRKHTHTHTHTHSHKCTYIYKVVCVCVCVCVCCVCARGHMGTYVYMLKKAEKHCVMTNC